MGRSPILTGLAALSFLLVPACGDDDSADDGTTTTAADEAGDDTTTTASTSTSTTVADATAEDPPGEAGSEEEGLGDAFVYVAELNGDTEVPGPGDPAGTGRIEIRSADDGELCIDMVAEGLGSEVTDAHVHEGEAGATGDPVIPIGPPTTTDGTTDTWSDVCAPVDAELLRRLDTDVTRFYANVHTAEHPDGAVRGQLDYATIFDLELS